MDKFSDWERKGIQNMLNSEPFRELTFSIAKTVSKNMLTPLTIADAIDVIILHSTTTQSILNRKAITKESLFKYLHSKKVPVTSDFTKQLLIEKILHFWRKAFYLTDENSCDIEIDEITKSSNTKTDPVASSSSNPEEFPINQMARKFATWFYENLNLQRLQVSDFFRDCKCIVQFLEQRQVLLEEEHFGAESVLEFCRSLQTKYNLYLNLNINHSGTQGRIDCHGLVLALTCGTLHKVDQFVGTFECVFGLSRDPFSQNNWKINQMNLRLHNYGAQNSALLNTVEQPTLIGSDSMAPLLSLAMPENDEIS